MALIVYGIPNCDTVKKARRWLDEQGVAYSFHDFRKDGLDAASAKALMIEAPAMIRRPVVEADGTVSVGFSADDWQQRFGA